MQHALAATLLGAVFAAAFAGGQAAAFPPALSFSPYRYIHLDGASPTSGGAHSICKYCLCDQHQRSVVCTGANILINTVHLPSWAVLFHVHNATVPRMPHFAYAPLLRVLRINACGLTKVHPLSFIPLPNLETVHLADNELHEVAETLFSRLDKLRVVNLAGNRITDLSRVELKLTDGLVLDELVLSRNPIENGFDASGGALPPSRQLYLADTRLEKVNSSHLLFHASASCEEEACRHISLAPAFWKPLITLDLGSNPGVVVEASAGPRLANLTALNLAHADVSPCNFGALLGPGAALRHLDLHDSVLPSEILNIGWQRCSPKLEWLDISGTAQKSLILTAEACPSLQWFFASRNKITSATVSVPTLRIVHLQDNLLHAWPFAGPLKDMETLSLGHNLLTTLPPGALQGFSSLTTLDVSHNRLLALDGDAFPQVGFELRYLNLSANLIRAFPTLILPKLLVLDLSANDLGSDGMGGAAFRGTPSLQHLHLAKNPAILDDCVLNELQLSEDGEDTERTCWLDSAETLTKLVELDLSECQITEVVPLKGLTALNSLNLAGNRLVSLNMRDLPHMLLRLDISRNHLSRVDNLDSALSTSYLQHLSVAENPLACDCGVLPLARLISVQPDFDDRSLYYCFSDNWQHPLKSYLESAETFCSNSFDAYAPTLFAFFVNFLALVGISLCVAIVFAFVALQLYHRVGFKVSAYAPVPLAETPVDV